MNWVGLGPFTTSVTANCIVPNNIDNRLGFDKKIETNLNEPMKSVVVGCNAQDNFSPLNRNLYKNQSDMVENKIETKEMKKFTIVASLSYQANL